MVRRDAGMVLGWVANMRNSGESDPPAAQDDDHMDFEEIVAPGAAP